MTRICPRDDGRPQLLKNTAGVCEAGTVGADRIGVDRERVIGPIAGFFRG
jgi:hypothetical protein